MFPESSTWRADVVRVTADGRRVPVERPWAGLPVGPARRRPGPRRYPSVRHHADAGLDNQLAFLDDGARLGRPQHAARPRDAATSRPGSPTWHNDDPPRGRAVAARRGGSELTPPPSRPPRARASSTASTTSSVAESAMRALAVLRVSPASWCSSISAPTCPTPSTDCIYRDAVPRAVRRPGTRSCPRPLRRGAVARRGRCRRHGRRLCSRASRPRPRSRSSRTTCSSRPPTSTTTAPTSSSCSGPALAPHRPRAVRRRVAGRRRQGRPARDRSRTRLAAVAAALRSRRHLRRLGPQQARRPRLVRRHRHLAARRPRPRRPRRRCPTGRVPS